MLFEVNVFAGILTAYVVVTAFVPGVGVPVIPE
jgi:hypothetical protein